MFFKAKFIIEENWKQTTVNVPQCLKNGMTQPSKRMP